MPTDIQLFLTTLRSHDQAALRTNLQGPIQRECTLLTTQFVAMASIVHEAMGNDGDPPNKPTRDGKMLPQDRILCRLCKGPAHEGLCRFVKKNKTKCDTCKKRHHGACQMRCNNCLLPGHIAVNCPRSTVRTRITLNVPDQPQIRDMARRAMGRETRKNLCFDAALEFPLIDFKQAGPTTAKNLKKKMHRQKRKKVWREKKLAEEQKQQFEKVTADMTTMAVEDDESVDEYSSEEEDPK